MLKAKAVVTHCHFWCCANKSGNKTCRNGEGEKVKLHYGFLANGPVQKLHRNERTPIARRLLIKCVLVGERVPGVSMFCRMNRRRDACCIGVQLVLALSGLVAALVNRKRLGASCKGH